MRFYCYNELREATPKDEVYIEIKSEEDIRKDYWPYWYSKVCEKYGQEYTDKAFSFEDCLDDWIIVNWAWESD